MQKNLECPAIRNEFTPFICATSICVDSICSVALFLFCFAPSSPPGLIPMCRTTMEHYIGHLFSASNIFLVYLRIFISSPLLELNVLSEMVRWRRQCCLFWASFTVSQWLYTKLHCKNLDFFKGKQSQAIHRDQDSFANSLKRHLREFISKSPIFQWPPIIS